MKEVIGKGKLVNNSLLKHLILNNRNIFDQKTIAYSFNKYFVNVGPKLACEITQSIARVFKSGDTSLMTNYQPISVLPCFSKMLERIMYNRRYKYLTENNFLYCKQFGFQKGHSPEHAVLQLVEQINQSFEKNEFTLGVFLHLSKAFDTVDHQILQKKLEYYGIAGNNLIWFDNYLEDRQQFIMCK